MLKTQVVSVEIRHEQSTQEAQIYVATDLSLWKTTEPAAFSRDVQINDAAYRHLDPEYFAWLRDRLVLVKDAANSGRLDRDAYETLRGRFKVIEGWAIEQYGERALVEAIRGLRTRPYSPPKAEEDVRRPERRPVKDNRLDRARRLVDAIQEDALRFGWKEDALYRSEGYRGRPSTTRYGLVCHIDPGERLGEVTHHWIEIIGPAPAEFRTRFYNPDVEQPWVRWVETARTESSDG